MRTTPARPTDRIERERDAAQICTCRTHSHALCHPSLRDARQTFVCGHHISRLATIQLSSIQFDWIESSSSTLTLSAQSIGARARARARPLTNLRQPDNTMATNVGVINHTRARSALLHFSSIRIDSNRAKARRRRQNNDTRRGRIPASERLSAKCDTL